LESCVSATNMISAKWDGYYVKAQGSVKYDKQYETHTTLAMLKAAVNPYLDYSFVHHMGRELDEWMDMYYQPCVAALFGKNIGVSSDVEAAFFMAYPWHTHAECTYLNCLSDSMRWNREAGGCVNSLIAGTGTHFVDYTGTSTKCSYDPEQDEATEACKYPETVLQKYSSEAVTECWSNVLPADTRIDYLIEHFCLPVVSGKMIEDSATHLADIETHCTGREKVDGSFRRKLEENNEPDVGNLKRRKTVEKVEEVNASDEAVVEPKIEGDINELDEADK
jgi:hypothetical protein